MRLSDPYGRLDNLLARAVTADIAPGIVGVVADESRIHYLGAHGTHDVGAGERYLLNQSSG